MNSKRITITAAAAALALAAGEAAAGNAAVIGTLPSQKVPAPVEAGDRNPFATRLKHQEQDEQSFDAESEESKIRQVFANLAVTGRIPPQSGRPRVLVGDLILAEGEPVPQVIENQTDELRVTRITDKEVELTWVNEGDSDAPRKLLIPVNLKAEVSFLLPGRQMPGSGGQFVVKAEKPAAGGAEGGAAPDPADEDPYADEDSGDQSAPPEAPARVSPFGLFRR